MHIISERERHSKVYLPNVQSIALNKDKEHQQITEQTVVEAKEILERKNIDKIMQNIIKERMFGNFMNQDAKVSAENYYNIDIIGKQFTSRSRGSRVRSTLDHSHYAPSYSVELAHPKRRSCSKNHYLTIDSSRKSPECLENMKLEAIKRRSLSRRLPSIVDAMVEASNPIKRKLSRAHLKKLDINEKVAGEKFKKWSGASNSITIYDIKVSRQTIINSVKHQVDPSIIERFFHFFNFPQSFGLRHFCNLVENAINCSLKFIYFWVFGLFDENANGILQSQDLFRFLQKFKTENYYIEQEVYRIQRYLMEIQKNFKPREQKELVEQTLIVNHNLKLDQLKDLLKESEKQRIDVNCVKNTCYHQTVMSLEHDPNQRLKQGKIQENQLETKRMKAQMEEVKKKLQNTPGIRFRDFYVIFGGNKRPKIFCYFISLLTGENGSHYQ